MLTSLLATIPHFRLAGHSFWSMLPHETAPIVAEFARVVAAGDGSHGSHGHTGTPATPRLVGSKL